MKIKFDGTTAVRLDKFLVNLKIEELYSRTFIDKLISHGNIRVNDKQEKKSYLLATGDQIEIDIPKPKKITVEGENIPLDVLYDDEYLAIINKPAGMTVHPAPGNYEGTLANALVHHFKGNLSAGGDEMRPGIVHRLDKDTSGVLVIAKDDRTHSLLSTLFQERKIKKRYKAVIVGAVSEDECRMVTPISRSRTDRKKMAVTTDGKEAITTYKVIKYYDYFTYLDVGIETGRTHQIRVHLSHINHPVLGDLTYSSLKRTLNMVPANIHKKIKYLLSNHLNRQALHAYKLEFEHPVTKDIISVECPLPEDFQYTLDWLEKYFI